MKGLVETLIDKRLGKYIQSIVKKICQKEFDCTFKWACEFPSFNDTTIGHTFRMLEEMAIKEVQVKLQEFITEVSMEMEVLNTFAIGNPFAGILASLWEEFLHHYSIKNFVECFVCYEWENKQQELLEAGIIDKEGDYIKIG